MNECSLRPHPSKPCDECPWRKDQPAGRFPVERYQILANTSYDMSLTQFACHKTTLGKEMPCAGFLLQGAGNNLGVRLAKFQGRLDPRTLSADTELFNSYKEMAIFNGVDPEDPVLIPCRSNQE